MTASAKSKWFLTQAPNLGPYTQVLSLNSNSTAANEGLLVDPSSILRNIVFHMSYFLKIVKIARVDLDMPFLWVNQDTVYSVLIVPPNKIHMFKF